MVSYLNRACGVVLFLLAFSGCHRGSPASVSTTSNCCASLNQQMEDAMEDRWRITGTMDDLAYYSEKMIHTKFDNHPPKIGWQDFYAQLMEDKGHGPLGVYPGNVEAYFKEVSYGVKNDNYWIKVILDYKVENCMYLSVAMIINGKLYWKDNFASPDQKIDEINWDEVNHFVVDMSLYKDLSFDKSQSLNLPNCVE